MAESERPRGADDTTDDGFLGGRLILRQFKRGHRAGHDAIILAASTAAEAGETVVDLGAGVGAAGLALASRVRGLDLVLVEIDPALAALASHNAQVSCTPARIVVADVADPKALAAAGLAAGTVDRVLMNPPFHDDARHPPSPDSSRRVAHSARDHTLQAWVAAAHRLLKSRGVLTLIWRADGLAEVLTVVGQQFGSLEVQPVHGGSAKPAVRILLRAIKGGRAPLALHAPAALDGSDSDVEAAMRGEAVLRLARGAE
jgi:tRNA1(Val) A37 N6-methylase TrmN6